jgi:TolB-like protein
LIKGTPIVKATIRCHHFFWIFLVLFVSLTAGLKTVRSEEAKTIAILPFTMNSAQELAHVQNGIFYMLYSRLSWQNHVRVIPKTQIQADLTAINTSSQTPGTGNQLVGQIAAKTRSDYVLTGSVTELAGAFSIDAKVYDIQNKRYMAFFEQSKITDDLIDKVDQIAATINKKAFDRSTVTYEQMEQEKQANITRLKRQNPEHLMKVPAGPQDQGPGWKVWEYLF